MTKIPGSMKRTMTVGELRRELADYEDETPVVFACDYGDYHHTTQVLPVGDVEEHDESELVKSAYSQSGVALNQNEEFGGDGDTVVVLSA